MKPVYLKVMLFLPLLLFIDWIVMVVFGCFASACGAENKFFCTVFCKVGIVLLSLTFAFIGWFILRKRKKTVQ